MRHRIVLLVCSVLTALAAGEILIRCLGHYTAEGEFYVGSRRLKPYHLPLKSVTAKIHAYLSSPGSFMMYDPLLGWSPRPLSRSRNGLYIYNSDGIRTASPGRAIPRTPPPRTLRIALFGDSFVHGDDVPFEETLGNYIEQRLGDAGASAEVLNFGVPGYGLDQAFLRWKEIGKAFSPHVVLAGFQAENVKRNVNMFRPLYGPQTGIPFAKPRYILDGGVPQLINVPPPDPKQLITILEHISSWNLIRYEYWFDPRDYESRIWLKSKLISFIIWGIDLLHDQSPHGNKNVYHTQGEPARVTVKILEEFAREVEAAGGMLYVVHLPKREDLKILRRGRTLPYANLLRELEAIAPVIHAEEHLLKEARSASPKKLYLSHFTAEGNRIVANAVCEFILKSSVSTAQASGMDVSRNE